MKNSTDPKIESLQKFMLDTIRKPLDAEMRIAKNANLNKLAEKYIEPTDKLSALERLEIYNQQYWYRMIDSLMEDFPGLKMVMGQESSARLMIKYLEAHPSRTHFLSDLGKDLHHFAATNPGAMRIDPPVSEKMCLDVIAVELAQIHAFDAEEMPVAKFDSVKTSELFKLELSLQPHISILKLEFEVREFILKLKEKPSGILYPLEKNNYLAVHRFENQVFLKDITVEEFIMLSALKEKASIETCVEKVLEVFDNLDVNGLALRVQEYFATWTRLSWICS